jgi:hypothetical protein
MVQVGIDHVTLPRAILNQSDAGVEFGTKETSLNTLNNHLKVYHCKLNSTELRFDAKVCGYTFQTVIMVMRQ